MKTNRVICKFWKRASGGKGGPQGEKEKIAIFRIVGYQSTHKGAQVGVDLIPKEKQFFFFLEDLGQRASPCPGLGYLPLFQSLEMCT